MTATAPVTVSQEERARLYFRYLIERGALRRYGDPFWCTPERQARIEEELAVIEEAKFSSTFVMLADVMDFCRREKIPYGPGRGSVGGCYTAYLAGIHDVDSIEWDLLFERFLNKDRVTFPDVDIDVSQRHRHRVLQYIVDTYNTADRACVIEDVTVTYVPCCAPDVALEKPQTGIEPASVAVITYGHVEASLAQKIENAVMSSAASERIEAITESVSKLTGLTYEPTSWRIMAVAAPAAASPISTFSNWIMSLAAAPNTDASVAAILISNCERRAIHRDCKSSAPTVIEPRHVLVDARITTEEQSDQVVLQVGAFVRAGGRAVVDLVATAMSKNDPNAWATATNLKKCFPETGSITGGQKIQRELHAWLYDEKGHGDKEGFEELAKQAGWLDHLLSLDGMFTHLGKHAAGVVILRKEDIPLIPTVEVNNADGDRTTVTAYDMYALDDLGYLKWDFLGLRTLDVITDAHRFEGGSGEMDDLLKIWQQHRDDPGPYEILQEADTVGVFQMETDGYRRTLRDFQPTCFDHIVQLVALYRPGALDFKREEDGKNMVQVFIDRLHGREPVTYDHPALRPILEETQGIILYQEQQMAIVRELGGFSLAQADELRRAVGKKKQADMDRLMPLFVEGCLARGIAPAVVERIRDNLSAAARYSWNKSHAVEYAIITWWSIWFKYLRVGFYAAEINSWSEKKERQAHVISEARQHVEFRPPDINVAEDRFIVSDGEIVFGLNGVKGLGDANRNAILIERLVGGHFTSFEQFCLRLPSLPISMKLALVRCGAFDRIDSRERLLATIPKATGDKRWTVAEHLNHNRNLKKPRPLPDDLTVYEFPSDTQLAQGEMASMGYYISTLPLKAVQTALARHSANVIGGEVEKIRVREDKNGNEYGEIHLVTPELTKQRVLIFASNWPQNRGRCFVGQQLLFRGRMDGGTMLADACWEPDDYRQFRKIKIKRGDEPWAAQDFDGSLATVLALESAGYRVRLL